MKNKKQYNTTVRAKWAMDGATDLREAATQLRSLSADLCKMHLAGIRLEASIADDYAHLFTFSKVAAKKFGLEEFEY